MARKRGLVGAFGLPFIVFAAETVFAGVGYGEAGAGVELGTRDGGGSGIQTRRGTFRFFVGASSQDDRSGELDDSPGARCRAPTRDD